MKILRFVSALLILGLSVGILAGCSNNKSGWEDTVILANHRDIHNYIGDPDVPADESDLEMDEYHNVTLGGITGIYAITSKHYSYIKYGYKPDKSFFAITECENKTVRDILPEMLKTANQMRDHLTITYGTPTQDVTDNGTTYRWTIAPTHNYILSIVFFVPNFQDFSAYCSDLNMLASEWGADYLSGGNLHFLRVDYDITQIC